MIVRIAIMHQNTYEYTYTFIIGTEGHRPLIESDGRKFFLQLTFSGLKSSREPADDGVILREKERFRERDKDPTYEKYVFPYTYSVGGGKIGHRRSLSAL